MAKRSYNQQCALAQALDVIGERWTLLLIRELLTGPRRFKELVEGLAGIGTNLLAARLKELEEHGLIARNDKQYELTALGEAVEPTVLALARFGTKVSTEKSEDALWLARWNVVALRYLFQPELAAKVNATFEFDVDDVVVQARVKGSALETGEGRIWKADLVLRTDGETFRALEDEGFDLVAAEESGLIEIEGRRSLLKTLFRVFSAKSNDASH